MKPDIVIVVKDQGVPDNLLTFSLRSIEKNLIGYGRVLIVTLHPFSNLQNCHYILGRDFDSTKDDEQNIIHKTLIACADSGISNPFLWFNNDYWIIDKIHVQDIHTFSDGTLLDRIKSNTDTTGYRNRLLNTAQHLSHSGLTTYNFDLHCPFYIDRNEFIKCMIKFPWHKKQLAIKSLYCNYTKSPPDYQMSDLKIKDIISTEKLQELIKGRWILTSAHSAFKYVYPYLIQEFPEKSQYEI